MLALLLNTSTQFYTAVYYLLVFYIIFINRLMVKMALGNEKISISENIVKVVGAKEFKVRRVKNCKLFSP